MKSSLIEKAGSSKPKKLTGPITPRKPRIKVSGSAGAGFRLPARSRYYVWPTRSRGQLILNEKDYKRVHDLLLRLEFALPDAAAQSTRRFVDEAAVIAGSDGEWGEMVVGTKVTIEPTGGAVAVEGAKPLGTGLIRRKRKDDGTTQLPSNARVGDETISTLSAGLSRKMPISSNQSINPTAQPVVEVLGESLVRKKTKP
jgi:regulator of Ty1 transposition protein 109